MAGGIDVKMGVSGIAQFKSAMNQAQQSVKTLDAQLKLNEKQYQATGDKETYMANKSKLLQQQIAAQNKVVKEGQNALKAMEKQGVDPASQAYQKMQQNVVNAQAAMLDMNTSLTTVGQTEDATAQKTDKLTDSLNGINKKVSFDAVLNGIGKITDGMEAAAQKVQSIVTDVWNTMVQAATWAESETNLAAMYGVDVETLQKMQGAAEVVGTSVDSMIKSQQKLKNNLVYGGNDFQEAIKALGVSLKAGGEWWKDNEGATGAAVRERMAAAMQTREFEDIFWDLGDALLHYDDAIERDAMANKIFGKSWMELMPLFKSGREEYEKAYEASTAVSEENVDKLNELQTTLQRLDQEYQKTKLTILGELAPAFNEVGGTVKDLLSQFNEYLDTQEGKEKLAQLSEAVTNLFSGLSDTDFSTALDSAKTILDTITGALGWIKDNKDGVITAIEGIGGAFLALKAAEVVGTLAQGANALKQLFGGGGGGTGAGGGNATTAAADGRLLAKTLPYLKDAGTVGLEFLPVALFVDGLVQDQKNIAEANEKAAKEADRINKLARAYEASGVMDNAGYRELFELMNSPYTNGTTNPFQSMVGRYMSWMYEDADDAMIDAMAEIFDDQGGPLDELWNQWAELMESYNAGENVYDLESVQALWQKMREQIEAAMESTDPPKVEVAPVMPEDAAAQLEDQLGPIHAEIIPTFGTMSHANGLPFVPFDGYIAALHKGERVVPANQNKSYHNTSNVYFDHVNVNGGIDADGLAARIAERTKHTLAGFGG